MLIDTQLLSVVMKRLVDAARQDHALREALRSIATAVLAVTDEAADSAIKPPTLSLENAIEQYKVKITADVKCGELSWSNRNRQKTSLGALLKWAGDRPIDELDYEEIVAAVTKLKDRSVCKHAPDTILTNIHDVRRFFGWLEDTGRWKPSFNSGKVFTVRKQKLFTLAESKKLSMGQDVFTPQELAKLYSLASRRQKMYMVLALNLAATQQQLSDLLVGDVHMDEQAPFVEFTRSKTRHMGSGTVGHYELWPETAELLREGMAATAPNPEGRALLTKDGHPLVRFQNNGSRCDPILMAWTKLLAKSDLPIERRLSFKYLRKTISDMVLRLSDESTQQLMLAHARRSIAARHYTGKADFTRLSQTLRRVGTELLYDMFSLPKWNSAVA